MTTVELPIQTKLADLQDLYDRGLYLQLYQQGLAWGALPEWSGIGPRVLASRLANQIGATRLAKFILRQLHREAPNDPDVRYCYTYLLLGRLGPYETWRRVIANPELGPEANDEIRSSWYALIGEIAALLRDFETAESWLRKADAVAINNPWVHICWAHLFEHEDRYPEALAAARRSFEVRPMYRAGVQAVGHLLSLLNQDAEAIELYQAALNVTESAHVAAQLLCLQMETRDYTHAQQTLDTYIRLSPLAEKPVHKWIAAQRSELAYYQGDIATAIVQAKLAGTPYFVELASNLEESQNAAESAVLLPVPFVRQHHVTCAPATLSAISRYWSKPAEHVQVADEICYNGTTNYAERHWAEQNGWVVREFSVTEESAQQLLDRGVPFTFVTVEPGNAHLQAIIGYDKRRRTLQVRDPYWRNSGETLTQKLLERYRAFGPRGMALVPSDQAATLERLELPDAPLWDLSYAMDSALVKHQRQAAQEAYEALCARAPDHRLTHNARRLLAIYDANPTEQLAAVEKWLEEFPADERLQWERLALMEFQTSTAERLALYEELCNKPDSHPIFWRQYARELLQDARRHADVERLLKKAIRRWPTDPANYYTLAQVRWDQRRWEEAVELYRFAACLGDKDEQFAKAYFTAATWVRQTDTLLQLLKDRFRRSGAKSGFPARTLAWAYFQLNQEVEALALLEEALQLRPQDGQLMLYLADAYLTASNENLPRATELLESARAAAPLPDWLRTSARLASAAGNPQHALAQWREVVALQPLAIDAHQAVTRQLAELEGRHAALNYLEHTCQQFPHHRALHGFWVEWLREEPLETREAALTRAVALAADDAWFHRELANVLARLQRYDEAWHHAEIAGNLEPHNPSYRAVRATLFRMQGRIAEAKVELQAAIELSVDHDYSIAEWMDLCTTLAERREALAFVRNQLVRQVTFGDGLLAFRAHAAGVLDSEELLTELQAALAARSDLWHAWSAVTLQLLQMNRLDEALTYAIQATERFPLLPKLWFDLSRLHRARLDFDAEYAALENALRVNPGWSLALRAMCDCLARRRDFLRARAFAEQAVAHSSLDPYNHVLLAEQLWRLEEREAALTRIRHAIHLDPGEDGGWELLGLWSQQMDQPQLAVETARELTVRRAGDARSWLILARLLDTPADFAERAAALDRALALNPHSVDAHDLRAVALAKAGRFREALAACEPTVFADRQPTELSVRAAWIEAERGDLRAAVSRIRNTVAEDPQHFSAWSHLAEWCRQLQDAGGYLEAAENMARLSPQYEMTLGFLGDARLINGDRAGAMEAYSRAFELAPTYEFAGNCLFDMQIEDGDIAGAARTMQVLRAHCQTGFVLARDVQLAVREKNYDRALERVRDLCVTECETRWPLQAATQELAEAGYSSEVEAVLCEAISLPNVQPDSGRVWMELALRRIDREHGGEVAHKHALEQQLSTTKSHFAAWMRLADDYAAHQQHDAYLRCAQALLRINRESELSHGYLGDARLLAGDRAGATAAFERALRIDPHYEFASNCLFDIYFEDRKLDAAAALIEALNSERPSPTLLARKVQFAAVSEHSADAAEHLRTLCLMSTDQRWALHHAVQALEASNLAHVAEDVLGQALTLPEAQADVGLHWGRLASERDAQMVQHKLPSLFTCPEVAQHALHSWFQYMAQNNRAGDICRFIKQHRAQWQADVRLWGQVGWVATLIRDYHLASDVCSNWRTYPNAAPWMLVNAAEGFRAKKQHDEAQAISHHALALPERDGGTDLHHLWLGCDAACAGDFDQAQFHAQRVQASQLDQDYQFLNLLLTSVLQIAGAPAEDRALLFRQVRASINAAVAAYDRAGIFSREPARQQVFYAATKRLASLVNTFSAKAWAAWWRLKQLGLV